MRRAGNVPKWRMRGPRRCSCVFDADTGFCLRVLPDGKAAGNWVRKHFPENPERTKTLDCASYAETNRVFDEQMALGLTDMNVISDLLWYGGIATAWKKKN